MSNKETKVEVITISAVGDATAMNSDNGLIHKASGRKHIQRATEILHDSITDTWYVAPMMHRLVGSPTAMKLEYLPKALTGFSGYQIAVAFEISWVKTCMLLSVDFIVDRSVCKVLRSIFDIAVSDKRYEISKDALPTALQGEGIDTVVNELLAAVHKLMK